MSNWHPKPLRPADPNPLFQMDTDAGYVVKSQTPIQRQRELDGTPHTKMRPSPLHAPDYALFLEDSKLNKSESAQPPVKTDPPLNPDMVVKSFMAKGVVDEDEESAEKGTIGQAVGGAAAGAAKMATGAVTGAAQMANRAK